MRKNQLDFPSWGLAAFSWIVAIYFMIAYHCQSGFPPAAPKNAWDAVHLLAGLFFTFLPFYKKVTIGKLLDLEREIERAEIDLKDFKETTANTLSVLSTAINTVSNSNTVNVSLPSLDQMFAARQQLESATGPADPGAPLGPTGQIPQIQVDQVRDEIVLEDEDTTMALVRLRIAMESYLRKIMRKRTDIAVTDESRYLPLGRLFQLFLNRYPTYRDVEQSFHYVYQICNAAVHAQRVPAGQANEALQMGARLVALFRDIAGERE